jgi:glycosyltransferase involved in cell wall biosynthesis
MTLIRKCARALGRRSRSLVSHALDNGLGLVRNRLTHVDASKRLLILDDMFPQMLSGFRIAEYNGYLEDFRNATVYSTASVFAHIGERRSFRAVVKEYEAHFPQYRGRVVKHTVGQNLRSGLVYTIFIDNAFEFVRIAERYQCPFVFTLYPGGGFHLWDKPGEARLRRVFSSRSFRKVIVTQKITKEYLLEEGLCSADNIEFVYGVVPPPTLFSHPKHVRRRFQHEKATFDICFVAHKYTHQGVDKGYDVFIQVAKLLSKVHNDIVFHVVGPFDSSHIDVSDIQASLRFHGTQYTDFFPSFYAGMDVILSPNRPFKLGPGSFDGFPTGACVEAGLCGVAVFCSDPLQQNMHFEDGKELVIVHPDRATEISQRLEAFHKNPDDLYRLSSEGRQAFRKVFDLTAQMRPRLNILENLLEN